MSSPIWLLVLVVLDRRVHRAPPAPTASKVHRAFKARPELMARKGRRASRGLRERILTFPAPLGHKAM